MSDNAQHGTKEQTYGEDDRIDADVMADDGNLTQEDVNAAGGWHQAVVYFARVQLFPLAAAQCPS